MDTKTTDFKLGMFVLGSLGLLCAGLTAFGAMSYFQKTIVSETYLADNADGLAVGAPVTLRGVRVGKVTRMEFSWNIYKHPEAKYVVVEFAVRDNISPNVSGKVFVERVQGEVQRGLRARVKAQGFTGSSLLALEYVNPAEYPAPPFPWTPRHVYVPSAPGQVGELLASLQKTLHNASQVDLNSLTGSLAHDLGDADRLMKRVEGDLGGVEKLVGHLDEVNYHELATNADTLITQVRGDLTRMRLPKVSNDADELLIGLKGTISQLNVVVANLDTGSLNDALANLRLASKELDDTLHKLQQYPAGFLLGKPPLRATSVEKTKD